MILVNPPLEPDDFFFDTRGVGCETPAKNGRAFRYFINISFRCLSLPRSRAAEARPRASLLPPSEHTRRTKRWRARKAEGKGQGKEGKTNIERRNEREATPTGGRAALYYIERRNAAAPVVSSPCRNRDKLSALS